MNITGRRYDNGRVSKFTIADGLVQSETPLKDQIDAPWIAPAMVDLQVNGYAQIELNDPELTVEQVRAVSLAMDEMGVGLYLPTLTTAAFDLMLRSAGVIAESCREFPDVAARVAGLHIEGPYISPEDGPRGAHPREHCRPPSWDEFQQLQQAAEGRIRLLTLSPEYDEAPAFIRRVAESGVVVAIGHTAADSSQIGAAIEAGATMSTHLGNGAHGTIRRHPNYIWDQLAADGLTASLIADGHHLPPAVLKSFWRVKRAQRCVLVSDLTSMAGMPPGRYATSGLGEVEVLESGKLVVAGQTQYLAGAAAPIGDGVANMVRFTDATFSEAVEMASTRPAVLIDAKTGGFDVGDLAFWTLFDWKPGDAHLQIRQLIRPE